MARRSWLTGIVVACACALALMMPVTAVAQHANPDCALCHGGDSMIQNAVFETGSVNRDTVCRKCHQDGLVGSHPNHYAGGDCSSMCHKDWGPSIAANVPTFLGSAGAFASPESQNVPAFQIHAIHSTPRWAAGITTENSKCGSCHAAAACTACHDGSVGLDPGHAGHGATKTGSTKASATVDPWVGDLAVGVSLSQSEDTMLRGASLLCGGTACHDIAGIATSAPFNMDSFNHPAYPDLGYVATTVTRAGTWREAVSSNYTLQRQATSNYSNATFSITFTGERVTLVSDRDPYRGIAEVLIDGVSKATVDQYSSVTQYQRPVWTSGDLGPGQHTITVRPTGLRNPNARATHVTIDKIKVYDSAVDTLVPDCTSCHPAMGDDSHGGEHPTTFTFSHDMTQTIVATNLWNTGYGTHSCDQCHQTALRNEHRRPTASSVSAPDSCAVCHPTYAGYTWTDTYSATDGCAYGTCHSVSTPREQHGNYAAQHAPTSTGDSVACNGCHAGDLRVVHGNSIPGNGKVEANGCLACHGTSKLDTNKSCSGTNSAAGSCHAGGFNTVGTHAIKSAGSHESSEAAKPFTRAYQRASGQDDGGVECAQCHSSGLVAAHAGTVPAVGCSTGGVNGKGCHLDTAYNSVTVASAGWTSRKCSDCHEYGTKRSHDSTLTPHLVASNGCAGTGSSCHNSNDLWALHSSSHAGGAPKYLSCANAGCHDSLAKDKRPTVNYSNSCGSTSTGCHTSFAPDHTGAFQHTFSAASYYNGATETGCTNQTGCHNQGVASTADFGAAFHPGAGCLAGACHGSNPSKPAFTGQLPTDCQECHTTGAYAGSAYQGAAPRTSLVAAPAAGGHYNSTAHTAGGMTTALSAGGSASAQCSQCHSPAVGGTTNGLMNQHSSIAIAGSPYGSALTCGECHGDNRARGNAEVVAKWTNNLCSDCHAAGTSSVHDHGASIPAVAESGSTCGATGTGCHTQTDLHALHKDAAGCNLTGCHDYTQQAFRPTEKGCGGATSCHTGYTNSVHGGVATGNEALHTAASMSTVLDATYNAGGANTCDACHSAGLEGAHAATITGNLGWSAPMCLECHNSTTPVNSVNVVKTTGWPAKTCDECHGAPNGPAKHAEYGTGHTGVEAAGCTWNTGCHGNTRDLRVLHNNTVASNGTPSGCDVAGCHDSLNKDMQSATKTCGSGGAGCHTDKTHNNHGTATAHAYTATSDYSETTSETVAGEAGCSGSGAGCHGTVGTRNGVDEFHAAKTAGCTATDACHGNAAFNQTFRDAGSGTDCVRCHNTTAFGATVDDMPLSGLSPAGHYGDALHTATAGLVNVNAGGTAQAACSSCHSLSLKDAHGAARTGFSSTTKGTYVTCQECHAYNINVISQVKTANWSTNACTDCHAVGVLGASRVQHGNAPVVAEVTTTCGATGVNCHTTNDLHALHKNAAGCNLTGCHDFTKQAQSPNVKSCGVGGGCHTAYTKDSHLHNGDAAKHQPTTLTQANATQFGVACGSCHDIRTSNSSLTLEHSLTTSAKSTNATNVCLNCHNNAAATTAVGNSWSAKDSTSACAACHTGGMAIHSTENVTAHGTEANTGCAASGLGCHNGTDLSRVGATNAVNTNIHTSCLRCHDRTGAASWTSAMIGTSGNLRYAPGEKRCGQASGCHTSDLYNPVSGVHRVGRGDVVNGNDAKHTAAGMTGTVGTAARNTCADCHSAGLTNAHPNAMTGWTNSCTSCHNSTLASNVSPNQVKAGWTADQCADCHTAGASSTKIPNMHARYTTDHTGVPAAGNSCDPACHPSYTTLELGDIHSERPNGCQITGCHALNTQMSTAVTAKSCGGTNACHNGYLDGNHGFNDVKHQTTDENSWKNCGRCHLGYRADYTRGGTFNGNLNIDAETPSGADQLHRNAANGGAGCNTCHDPGSRVFDPKGTKTANCSQCHVDHYGHTDNKTQYTTTATSNTNLAKTLSLDFTGMATADVFFDLATTDNAVAANARIEIGPVGSPFYSQTVSTTAMDPNRKKFSFRNIDVAGRTGSQPVRLYVWKGTGTATIINDTFDASVARGTLETLHTADVGAYTCSFGDCHEANIIAEHDKYEIPGAATGNYVWPATPTRENLSTVQGPASTTLTKVKSLTVNLDEIDKIRVRLNLYCADTTARTLSFQVRIGATVLASGNYNTTSVQRWWDYSQGGTNPAGTALDYINTTGYSGDQTIDLWIQTNRATTAGAARNNTFQIWAGEREYAASTPTDPCDVCHLNAGRVDEHGNPDPTDLNLTASTPKLTGIGAQCDTCHPNWASGHPQFGHRASTASNTCILGCHQYKPAIDGTPVVDPYDLTQKHKWGNNTGVGMTYTPGTVLGSETFGTTTTWPGTWTRSDVTYVTNQTGSAQGGSGAAPQIGVNTTRTEYNFYRTAAFNTQNYSGGGLLRFWYQVNVGDTSDYLIAEYSTVSATGPYTELWRRDTDALTWTQTPWLNLPRAANVWVRFRGTFNTAGEYGRVDTLEVNGGNRSFSGTMEGGCATGSTGACHNQGYPTRGECQDCHTSVNHHDAVHDLSVGGTRTEALLTGFSFNSCVGTCHSKNLHWNHGVGLSETQPRPYRGPGMASDGIMTCATCHASTNATIKNLANDASTPIASRTLTCGQCHTGTAGMAGTGHAGVPTNPRTANVLKGANLASEFSNTTSVSGHRAGSYTNAFDPNTGTTLQERWYDGTRWYMASGTGRTQFNFNNFTAAPGQTNAAGLLRATIVGPDGTAGTAVPLRAGGTALTTTMNVHCSDCHGETTASMEGPQGAATNIGMLDGFTTRWVDQTNNLIVDNTLICNRCHNINLGTATTSAHRSNGGHVGSGRTNRCIACHVAIPHAWKRPKLLVNRTRDAGTPYVINPGTATGTSLGGWTPSGGAAATTFNNSGNCQSTGCRSHSGADTVP